MWVGCVANFTDQSLEDRMTSAEICQDRGRMTELFICWPTNQALLKREVLVFFLQTCQASEGENAEPAASVNVSQHTPSHCCRYERQVKELKAELAMRDMLNGRSAVNYGDLSEEEAAELQALVKRFLQGGEQASLLSVRMCGCVKSVWLVRGPLKGAEQASLGRVKRDAGSEAPVQQCPAGCTAGELGC